MRVFQIEGDWGIDHLKLSQRPEPKAKDGEVLVRMRASSLNYRDLVVPERGYGSYTGQLPLIPISDGVGEVIDVGAGTGILSMMAMDHGAKCVYAIEMSDICKVADEQFQQRYDKKRMAIH